MARSAAEELAIAEACDARGDHDEAINALNGTDGEQELDQEENNEEAEAAHVS